MKRLILFLIVALPVVGHAQCNKTVDSKKVILFIDTNNSEPEIATAQKAACARGERIVIVPKNYLDYGKYTKAVEETNKAVMSCTSNCEAAERKATEAYKNLEKFKSSQKATKDATKEALDELKSQNAKLQTFMISGHDGGGSFGGSKGHFSRHELSEMMKDYSDINEVKSLMLLGCYTGVQKEVIEWKNIFPDAKLIAGYDGSAPLSDKPLGHQYISEILLKEPQLLAQADQAKLQAYARANIKSLFQMNTAMYLNCGPGEGQEFYYASKAEKKQFSPYDINACLKKGAEIDELQIQVSKFESGEVEPPKDTARGELRELYNKARALEHCVEILGRGPNVNNVFNLLFYDGVKKSFASFYDSDLTEAQKAIAAINLNDLEAGFLAEMAKLQETVSKEESMMGLLETNPEAYFAQKQQEIDTLNNQMKDFLEKNPFLKFAETNFPPNFEWTPERNKLLNEYYNKKFQIDDHTWNLESTRQNKDYGIQTHQMKINDLKSNIHKHQNSFSEVKQNPQALKDIWVPNAANLQEKSRKELLENIHRMNGLLSIPGLPAEQKKALSWVNLTVSNHLQYFQNPFSWHEHTPANVEAPSYPVKYQDYNYEQHHFGGGMLGGSMSGGFGGGSSEEDFEE